MELQSAVTHLGAVFEHIAADGQMVLDELHLPAGAEVLDVGTGVGNFAIFLAMRGFEVLTGEPDTDTTQYARKDWAANAAAVGVATRIRFQAFNASAMPFADERFAAVFFFGVLHHVDEAERARVFSEALRVVRAGGAVVFFEPNATTLKEIWGNDPGHPLAAHPGDYVGGAKLVETRLRGRRMDIFMYRAA
ncbi:class I SAM-dependent methyltransferase [Acidocella sp. KAb 2-4]|uniref:class I SAM-dependent methyltransferase n=1 Tax=Acidocella sp. KAb 2-4 TaxID=2885158 RepID=UPI001D069B54|nr:class I SAM-dependent methyltransferase [Acidocella sp. KAb 2-4]MCB5944426.1 class I SAM-dependent methyltransferase [Acidocella sp. KAb 2-4]